MGDSHPRRTIVRQERPMTYNRMQAKPIAGEHCRFCGDETAPLVKTRCCEQWICCDTSYLSYRGCGHCQFAHEHYSVCHYHYNEKHPGRWQECEECRRDFGEEEFRYAFSDWMNIPRY